MIAIPLQVVSDLRLKAEDSMLLDVKDSRKLLEKSNCFALELIYGFLIDIY